MFFHFHSASLFRLRFNSHHCCTASSASRFHAIITVVSEPQCEVTNILPQPSIIIILPVFKRHFYSLPRYDGPVHVVRAMPCPYRPGQKTASLGCGSLPS